MPIRFLFAKLSDGEEFARHDKMTCHTLDTARLRAVRMAFSDLEPGEWAKKIGFNRTQYSNWENGQRRIPVDRAEKLCDLYGLTLDSVYRGRRDGLSERASKVL